MCLRNLLQRRVRTLLSIFGVSLAVIFVVAIGATTTSYTRVIRDMNVFFSGDIVVVSEGTMVVQAFPVMGGNIPGHIVEEVSYQIKGVKKAVPMLVRFGYQIENVIQLVPTNVTIGIPPNNWSALVGQTPLKPGGDWPSTYPDKKEAVVGPSLADQLDLVVGSKLKVRDMNLTVTGILDTRSALLSRSIILPLELAQHLYYGHTLWVNMIVAELEEGEQENIVANRIEEEISGLEALTANERNQIVEPLLGDIETWNLGLSTALYLLSMILVTMVAMINVSERIRDFATLNAIGTPRISIFRIVLTETSLIGVIGGLVGIFFGSIAAMLIANFYTDIPLSLLFADIFDFIPPFFIVRILASIIIVSGVAGVIPAIAASRMNIAETLRAEY